MGKIPAFTFYPGDWLRDHVSGCSLAAQGLWLRMMILAHDDDRYGYLTQNGSAMPPESIARRCGCSLEQYLTLLAELDSATVPSRTPEGIIFSRRMVRDHKARKQTKLRVRKHRKRNGDVTPMYEDENEREKGVDFDVGSKSKPTSKAKPSLEEVTLYCQKRHNSVNPERFIDFYTARNWKYGRGVPMTDWKAAVRTWERNAHGGSNGTVRESEAERKRRKTQEAAEQYRRECAESDS